ncbi:hypothetical protein Daus18300_007584 [Diaporthe australafricana]|uniref:Uncharacterized protein n=1 Tax=Diaporthe australafricana TaxID=127596 RepID=A0ABR3WMF6_9PEZI
MTILLLLFTILAVGAVSGVVNLQQPPLDGLYSTQMAMSIIARQQGILNDINIPGLALQAGIVQKALSAWTVQYGDHELIHNHICNSTASAARYMTSTINDLKQWPLDRFSSGNAMFGSEGPGYDLALDALRDSVRLNMRNKENGLWYWSSYPEWSYLDGMYSFGPFAALDALLTVPGDTNTPSSDAVMEEDGENNNNDSNNSNNKIDPDMAALQDMHLQFSLLWSHCYNSTSGLLVHGYDESRKASWASGKMGASGIVWGRSLGWFMMGLVDTLEILDTAPARGGATAAAEPLLNMYQTLAAAVMRYADRFSGGWYQVVDQPGRRGNYVESSATAMFSYALLKGARKGYLAAGHVHPAQVAGRAAHDLLAREFVTREANGTLSWNGTVAVCSLNSTATYDYYIEQPLAYNSVLGAAAFVMSSLEVESLDKSQNTPQ